MKNLKNKFNVFFIGVGGAGMSVLAKTLILKGFKVSGSDLKVNESVLELIDLGLKFFKGHNLKNILGADVVAAFQSCPKAGISVCSVRISLHTEHCTPSVKPDCVHVATIPAIVFFVCPFADTSSDTYLSPQIEHVYVV